MMYKSYVCFFSILLSAISIASSLQSTENCADLKLKNADQLVDDTGICAKLTENVSHLDFEESVLDPLSTCKCNLIDKEIYWKVLKDYQNERLVSSKHQAPAADEQLELEILEEQKEERKLQIERANAGGSTTEYDEVSDEDDDEDEDEEDESGDDLVEMIPIESIDGESSLASDGSRSKTDLQLIKSLQKCTSNSIFPYSLLENLSLKNFKEVNSVPCEDGVKFYSLATLAYTRIRSLLGISPQDYLESLSNDNWIELSNPGASGSGLYFSGDKRVIFKTTKQRETEMLLKMLPSYYLRVRTNSNSLISPFLGQYKLSTRNQHISLVAMSNLFPADIKMHQKYDLKGSTYGRTASEKERAKSSPTFKDLDFKEHHKHGIFLNADVYDSLMLAIEEDLAFLESFEIMDYSLLLGIHNLDLPDADSSTISTNSLSKMSAWSAIPAYNRKGERLLLFMGIVDVLQAYTVMKKLEHKYKTVVKDYKNGSIQEPHFYRKRFKNFLANYVFVRG